MYENKLNGKKYIGQSTNIERRKSEHLKYPSKFSRFDMELQAIGEDGFNFIVLEECTSDELDEREKYWIKYYDTINNGYNLTPGGQTYRGEENPLAKLTDNQVKEIIKLLEQHTLTNKEIAELYHVHLNTIDGINRCKNWTHLHNYKKNIRQENLDKLERPHNSFAGVNNPRAKINEDTALKIIDLIKNTDIPLAQIARIVDVKDSLVYDINRCKRWKYLHTFRNNIRNEFKKGMIIKNED